MNAITETAGEPEGWSLGMMETTLSDLCGTIRLLGHIAHSGNQIEPNELVQVRDRLDDLADLLRGQWEAAFHQNCAEQQAHKEALAKVKVRKAAPGSPEDLERASAAWSLLLAAGRMATQACEEARPTMAGRAGT
jgi:hypothetical protein